MSILNKLIIDYRFELVEDHNSPGSSRYGVKVILPADIIPSFAYLNTILDDTLYDHKNSILIGINNHRRYAFRPHEIHVGLVTNPSEASLIVDEVIEKGKKEQKGGKKHIQIIIFKIKIIKY